MNLEQTLSSRIVFLDGAMGTTIQGYRLTEADYRGQSFLHSEIPLKGNHDLLSLTRPDVIQSIHEAFFRVGCDIVETNTFSSNRIAQADYGLVSSVRELNEASVRVAQAAREAVLRDFPERTLWIAGALGPTNRTASLSPDVERPGFRAVDFETLESAYFEQATALLEAGVDLLLPETAFDTLNLKAACFAIERAFAHTGKRVPVVCSVTLTDLSGRTLSGQTVEAVWASIEHVKPLAIGINCALGPRAMAPFLERLSRIASCAISCYPNAGLPNPLSETGYDETPEQMAEALKEFAHAGWLNIVGGCCGTTPAHLKAMIEAVQSESPRKIPNRKPALRLSGLESFELDPLDSTRPFVMIGERTNVMGSPLFKKRILAEDFEGALQIARTQIESGSNIIDINFDEGLLDSKASMVRFLNLLMSEPDLARTPIMVDSSNLDVCEAGLRCLQGKSIVNSISLKEGEERFREAALIARRHGAAVVVMAFDEQGQAASYEDKVRICQRAYRIWVKELAFPPEDLIFDPNILTIGTGIEEHQGYALDFIRATKTIKETCPGAWVSGGVSNLSFAFRGQNQIREAMHAVFLYHAKQAGLDMAIVNSALLIPYDSIDSELRERVEDLVLNRKEDATERLLEWSQKHKDQKAGTHTEGSSEKTGLQAVEGYQARLEFALVNGVVDTVEQDTLDAYAALGSALKVIEGPLMDGMREVGDRFGSGRMFLPQVVKSARVMKRAVSVLLPYMDAEEKEQESASKRGKILLATVKGDVHDIGKNIVGVVLACNGFDVRDLGVMVPSEKILTEAKEWGADWIGLSGLITPSLEEMILHARMMEREGFKTPLLIGGATTSRLHTGVKIAPEYSGVCMHVPDASRVMGVINSYQADPASFRAELKRKQQLALEAFENARYRAEDFLEYSEAQGKKFKFSEPAINWKEHPEWLSEIREVDLPLQEVKDWIDWSPFFWTWGLKGTYPKILEDKRWGKEAQTLLQDAMQIRDELASDALLKARAVYGFFEAKQEGDDLILSDGTRLCFLRQQRKRDTDLYLSLSDFCDGAVGGFAISIGDRIEALSDAATAAGDDYRAILIKAVGDRLAEAGAEWLHWKVRLQLGQGKEAPSIEDVLREDYIGIRPAYGYPSVPDHTEKKKLWDLLQVQERLGLKLTENFAMYPSSAVSGLYFSHPESRYFQLGPIAQDQVISYAKRKQMDIETMERWLSSNLGYARKPRT